MTWFVFMQRMEHNNMTQYSSIRELLDINCDENLQALSDEEEQDESLDLSSVETSLQEVSSPTQSETSSSLPSLPGPWSEAIQSTSPSLSTYTAQSETSSSPPPLSHSQSEARASQRKHLPGICGPECQICYPSPLVLSNSPPPPPPPPPLPPYNLPSVPINISAKKEERVRKVATEAVFCAVCENAKNEALSVLAEVTKCAMKWKQAGDFDTAQLTSELKSTATNLLQAGAQAYLRSEASPKILQKLKSTIDDCSKGLMNVLPEPLKNLLNIISIDDIKEVLEIVNKWQQSQISGKEACASMIDLVGMTICQKVGSKVGQRVGATAGGVIGGIVGAFAGPVGLAAGGGVGAAIGRYVGGLFGEEARKSIWELIKEAFRYIINYIQSFLV